MSESQTEQGEEGKGDDAQSNLPNPERRVLVSKLAKAAVVVPVATFLYDASNNAANGY